jgi:DNA (cytosine-5)-methyltransferase 1
VIVDAFAGPGGWDLGLRMLGREAVGFEIEKNACATRVAAGLLTVQQDVSTVALGHLRGNVEGAILSTPCQDFSLAGKQFGIEGYRGRLVYEVIRWARELDPMWLACEQVPQVLPIWKHFALALQEMGYKTWVGKVNAADFGVPQVRRRAILMASKKRFRAPQETHTEGNMGDDLFGNDRLPWVTMAQGLGWPTSDVRLQPGSWADGRGGNRRLYDPNSEPAPTVCIAHDSSGWAWVRPSTTVVGSFRPDIVAPPDYRKDPKIPRQKAEGAIQVTLGEAAALQSFPIDYPWQGAKTRRWEQVGNAVPPLLAKAILKELVA